MKKTLLISSIATVVILTVAIFYIYFKEGDNNILSKIPNYSKSVLVIDVLAISKKIFLDEFGKKNKNISSLAKSIPDSLATINWNESGLMLFSKMALFTIEDSDSVTINFIIAINDIKKYKLFIDDLSSKLNFGIQKKENISFAHLKSHGILIAWNKNFVSGMKTNENSIKNQNILKNILSTDKSKSILYEADFEQKLKKNCDVLFYSKPYAQSPLKQLVALNSNMQNLALYIDFNDGEIETNLELKTKPNSIFTKLLSPVNKDFNFIDDADTSAINIYLNIEPNAFMQIFNPYSKVQLKTDDIPYFKAWNGELNLVINGFKSIESEYITYEFDDNFNKIEIKSTKQEKILNLQAAASFTEYKLDSVFKLNKPRMNGNDTLLFNGANYILRKENNYITCYNKLLDKPALKKKLSNNNISICADWIKLINLLNQFGVKMDDKLLNYNCLDKIYFTATQKEEIEISSKFYFKDKKKNSLFNLLDCFAI